MTAKASAGTTLKISASQPGTFDASGYNTLLASMTLVGEVVNMGEFGRMFNLITHNAINTRGTVKLKGSFNEGQISLQLALDTDDAGQILMKAAALSDNDYSFAVTANGTGDKYYFQAKVMSFKPNFGTVDQVTAATAVLELTVTAAGVGIVESLV